MAQAVKMADFAQQGDYPLANTQAARMLAAALKKADQDEGMSQRSLAKLLGYKTSVALSHMALGRAPIPLDRCMDMARLLKMDQPKFLLAVLEQRHPDIDFVRILVGGKAKVAPSEDVENFVINDLEALAGQKLSELPVEKMAVIKEVMGERQPQRRWLTVEELPVMDMIRKARPAIGTKGLTPDERKALQDAVDKM